MACLLIIASMALAALTVYGKVADISVAQPGFLQNPPRHLQDMQQLDSLDDEGSNDAALDIVDDEDGEERLLAAAEDEDGEERLLAAAEDDGNTKERRRLRWSGMRDYDRSGMRADENDDVQLMLRDYPSVRGGEKDGYYPTRYARPGRYNMRPRRRFPHPRRNYNDAHEDAADVQLLLDHNFEPMTVEETAEALRRRHNGRRGVGK